MNKLRNYIGAEMGTKFLRYSSIPVKEYVKHETFTYKNINTKI